MGLSFLLVIFLLWFMGFELIINMDIVIKNVIL